MSSISITDQMTIEEVQTEFQSHFPFLKLEFYKSAHGVGEGSTRDTLLMVDEQIGNIRTKKNKALVNIHGNLKVRTFESILHDELGLNVQVFRRSGNLWLQTTSTDNWTLSAQNNEAKEVTIGSA